MGKKMNLSPIKITSFVTSLGTDEKDKVKGGTSGYIGDTCLSDGTICETKCPAETCPCDPGTDTCYCTVDTNCNQQTCVANCTYQRTCWC